MRPRSATVDQVVALPDGGFMVVWNGPIDSSGYPSVLGRRFDAQGAAVGPEVTFEGVYGVANVAAATDGTLVLGWALALVARFTTTGMRVSEVIQLMPEDPQSFLGDYSTVGATANGGFVAVWDEAGGLVRGQRFDAANQPLSEAFVVSSNGEEPNRLAVASSSDGSFVVVSWDDGLSVILARQFDAQNTPLGESFVVAQEGIGGLGLCVDPSGSFAVAWEGDTLMEFRRYNAMGQPETPVLSGDLDGAEVACLPEQNILIAGAGSTGSTAAVVRAIDAQNRPAGQFVIPLSIGAACDVLVGAPSFSNVAVLREGTFVIAPTQCPPAAGVPNGECEIFAQRFALTAGADCSGDCNGDGVVTVDEILGAVDLALRYQSDDPLDARESCRELAGCPAIDTDLDCRVTITDIVAAVTRALEGCR
jgi:hypothetical protein